MFHSYVSLLEGMSNQSWKHPPPPKYPVLRMAADSSEPIRAQKSGQENRVFAVFFLTHFCCRISRVYLVGGLEHEFYDFPFSWECDHPN